MKGKEKGKGTTKGKTAVAQEKPKRQSGLNLAHEALIEAGKPMNQKQLAEAVIARGWATKGKTPGATLYVGIMTEIKKKGAASRFARAKGEKGSFVAVSQHEQGA